MNSTAPPQAAQAAPQAAIDEMVDGRAGLRPHWRALIGAFSSLGEGGLAARGTRLDRAFEEEGLSSVLPGATDRIWRCDPVPLPLPAGEFATLAAGLAQRATLLEAVLSDLYGAQTLLASGALPPALVYANPGYLRFGRAERAAGPQSLLHFYAADLIRAPDGRWRVLADRTVTAAGIGYARENRRLLARVLPEAFRAAQVRQLAPFFDTWQEALRRLAPARAPDAAARAASVALLTPGTGSPLWFEHMYLARELSCALVEGGDLTVRGGQVFLKTLRGLQPVDVLLRRIDGRMIDPLELESASLIGVPGLIDAARAGSVRITNDPGSGAAEAPALAAFLPDLCRRLLGAPLALESVPTLWLGSPGALDLIRRDPSRFLLQPALDGTGAAIAPAGLPPADRQALMARIAARPWEWAATEAMPASLAPCLGRPEAGEGGLVPRPVVLRLFLVHDGTAWQALPGGFARVAEGAAGPGDAARQAAPGLPDAGLSKDVWVLAEDELDIVGPAIQPVPALALRRSAGDLPSRVADDLFWLGRYVERLEGAARLVRAAAARLSRAEAMLPRETAELATLGRCLLEAGLVAEEAAHAPAGLLLGRALLDALAHGGAIEELLRTIAGLTESVRDRLTGDMYATFIQALRSARRDAAAAAGPQASGAGMDALAHAMVSILRFATAVAGVAAENMVRGGGWLFLELGRRIERAHAVAVEIACTLEQPAARIETGLRLALELCDSAITYRSRYLNVLQPAPVLDLVLADQGNPRGLAFQLVAMHTLLDELGADGGAREMLAGTAAGLLAEAETLVGSVLAAADQAQAATMLPAPLRDIATGLADLSNRIARRYFALLPATRTLGMQGLVVGGEAGRLRGAA